MTATALKTKFFNSGIVYVNAGQTVTNWEHTHWDPGSRIEIVGGHFFIGLEKPSIFEADAKLFIPDTVSDNNAQMRHSVHRHSGYDPYVDHTNLVFPSDARPILGESGREKAYWGYQALNGGPDRRGIQFAWIVWYI